MDGAVEERERIADELYGSDPDEFIAARVAAVKAAKASGDRALAAAVGQLRRPTRSAWLVNLLARTHPDRVAALSDLAARLPAATAAGDIAALRTAGAERTTLVSDLTRVVVGLGTARGYDGGETVRSEVTTTLQAALADPAVLAQVLVGRVEKAHVYAGFGFGFPAPTSAPEAPVGSPATPTPDSEPTEGSVPEVAAPELIEARQKVEGWTALLAEAVATTEQAAAADEEAQSVLDRASQEVADLRAELKAAEAAELAARQRARTTSDDLHDARTAEQQAAAALDRAQKTLAALG